MADQQLSPGQWVRVLLEVRRGTREEVGEVIREPRTLTTELPRGAVVEWQLVRVRFADGERDVAIERCTPCDAPYRRRSK